MFAKNEKPRDPSSAAEVQPTATASSSYRAESPVQAHKVTPSIISADLKITGDLQSDGDIHVDGTVDGDIYAKSVTIGENAKIGGKINGERVRICGALNGGIDAAMVELTKSARVEGDIVHGSLQIEAGAHLEGNLRRRSGQSAGNVTSLGSSRDAEAEEAPKAAAQGGLH